MPEPDCFLRYRMRCNAEFYYVGKIPSIGIGRPSLQRRVALEWFYSPRAVRKLCRRYMRSTECSSSLTLIYRIVDSLSALGFQLFFTLCNSWHQMKLMKQFSRVNSRAFCFWNRCIDAWNSLFDDIAFASSVCAFNKKLYCRKEAARCFVSVSS